MLLTQLVLEDYVKLRGPLFYRLVCAIADPDDDVRHCAEHAVLAALGQRSRGLLHAKFVEVVLVLTGCACQPAFAHLLEASASTAASGPMAGSVEASIADLDPAGAASMQARQYRACSLCAFYLFVSPLKPLSRRLVGSFPSSAAPGVRDSTFSNA